MRPGPLSAERRLLLDRLLAGRGLDRPAGRIVPAADRSALPLSFAQQRIWYLNRMLPDETIYNVAGAARLRGRLDVDVMRRSMREVLRRHEVLRTTYHPGPDGKGTQRVGPVVDVPLPVTDLRGVPAAERDAAVKEAAAREVNRPFDLEHDLMLRPVLLRVADDEHLLVLCQHHVATDGWSLNLLIREVTALYAAYSAGEESPLPPLDLQYGDFAAWEREWLTGERMAGQIAYWKERLAGARLVDAATGLPRPTELTWDGGTLEYRMPAELVRGLTRLAETERATPYMALVAAYSVVLSRWSGQDDIVIGCPVAGRTRDETAPLIGCFLNELPLRLDLTGAPTYRDLLRQARDVCLGAYDHQDVPFEKVVEEVNPERDAMSHAPLVRHQLGLHNEPRWRAELPGLTFEVATLSTGTARFDLEVDLTVEEDGGIHGMVYFSTDLYREDVVRRMLDRLTTVVEGAVADPDGPVRHLPLLGRGERDAVARGVIEPSSSAVAEPSTVHALVEEQAARRPGAVAVRQGARSTTYKELDDRANRLARWLRQIGVVPDRPVPVVLPASAERLVAILAVLKAGGAAVPADPAHGGADVRSVLAATAATLVLTDADTLLDPRLRLSEIDPSVRMLALDTVAERVDGYDAAPLDPVAGPDDLAVIGYARRPGGGPAGAGVTHAGAVHRLRWLSGLFPLQPGEGVLTGPAGLDGGAFDLLWPLSAGARLVLPDGGDAPDGSVAELVVRERVGTARIGASGLAALLADPEAVGCRSVLHAVVVDGDEPWPALREAAGRILPGARVAVLRGAPEAAADLLATGLDGEAAGAGARGVLLDPHGEAVPIGVPGELCLDLPYPPRVLPGQDGEALFAPDPQRPGSPLFRTGRRARLSADGRLEPLGPAGDALTLRGHHTEVADLAGSLAGLPEVDRAAVLAHPDPDGGDARLVGYVTLREDDGAGGAEQWSAAFESAYGGRPTESDPWLNLGGWTSPSTGEFLPAAEMRDWSEGAYRRILALEPHDVLEIGCRTGSLLFKLAPRCDGAYIGTDLSARALTRIRQHQDWLATKAESVRLMERGPGDFGGLADGAFDTVVLNGVTSYFTGLGHLEGVLADAVRVVRAGGAIYLGDVRNGALLEAQHLSAPWGESEPDEPAERLLQAIGQRVAAEEELAVAPEAFLDLASRIPGVTGVSLLPKLSRARNELTLFRYDAILHVGGEPAAAGTPVLDWAGEGLTAAALKERLDGPVVLRGVPDIRLDVKFQALDLLRGGAVRTVGELTEAIRPVLAAPGGPVDPAELVAIAREHGHEAAVRYGDAPGTVDVVIGAPAALPPRARDAAAPAAAPALTNDPARATRIRTVTPRLKNRLQTYFPTYMVPSRFMVVDAWPLALDGTLDRAALPLPVDSAADAQAASREPTSETERRIAKIWSEALGIDQIGVHDDFFSLGGHSLLGAEVVESVREIYDVDLPLGRLFESPTVAAAAEYIDGLEKAGDGAPRLGSIQRIDRSGYRTRRAREAAGAR